MNYIYDITVNLDKNNLYEFYEWNEEDNLEFILKTPIFKVDLETFLNIKRNEIIISKKILNMIENKTELYNPNCIKIIRYSCAFVCDKSSIVVEFDSEGNNYMKSNLSIEQEEEIIELSKSIKYTIIDYKVKKINKNNNSFFTRNEKEVQLFLIKKLETIKENKEYSKLKYIFYEIFNEKIDDIDKIYNKLILVTKNMDYKYNKLNELLNLMDYKKMRVN